MSVARFIALVIASAMACAAFVGCAPTTAYVAARNVETGAASFVNASADLWHAYSHAKLENCKDAVADYQSFLQCANDWEENGVKVADKAIIGARDAVHDLDTALGAADAVQAKDFSAAVGKAITLITDMLNTLTGLGVKLPAFKVN